MKSGKKLKEIEQIILKNYTNCNFCVDNLTEISELSTSYLRELFYKHFCICPQRYIENIRLECAIVSLSTEISLYELSSHAGFCDAGALRRAIKRRFNITPTDLKEMLQKNNHNALDLKQSLIEELWNHNAASCKEPRLKKNENFNQKTSPFSRSC